MRTLSALRTGLIALFGLGRRHRRVLRRRRRHQFQRHQGRHRHRRLGGLWHAHLPRQAVFARDRRDSYGFTFGASETRFRGTVSNIRGPGDVSGVYAAGNVGAAVGRGAQAIVLTNQHGAILELTGNSVGAIVSADLNGLVITVR